MATVFLVFCICWLPDTIHFLIDPTLGHLPVFISRGFAILFISNSAINPFIFAWKFNTFKRSLDTIFCDKLQRRTLHINILKRNANTPVTSQVVSFDTTC